MNTPSNKPVNPTNPNVGATDATNPTGAHYHAPHEPSIPHSKNDPLQTPIKNPPNAGPLLNQDPKFGNLTADGVHTTDGRTLTGTTDGNRTGTTDGTNNNGDRNADGTLRNPAVTTGARNADGTVRK